ncbi:MAG TPA: hypothetical protein ENN23_07615 [Deltaproteobacteria bacterium]|nr:hypothetical protein [Deltaproteobacteria bacterium]
MFGQIILISFLGGLLCLDRVFIQAMVARPVVIAPIIGLLLNNPFAGLLIGAFIELIWIDRIPVGTYVPPNDSIAAIIATSTAIIAGQQVGGVFPELISLSILIALPFGILAKQADVMIIKSNNSRSDEALEDARNNKFRKIELMIFLGLSKVFVFTFLYLLFVQSVLIPLVIWAYPILPDAAIKTLLFANYFLPLLGIAVAINTFKLRGVIPVFCAIFLILAVILEFFHVG